VVSSLAHPGDNITGVSFLLSEIAAKQVELLHELVPKAAEIGFLVNPKDPTSEAATDLPLSLGDSRGSVAAPSIRTIERVWSVVSGAGVRYDRLVVASWRL